jgi:hypothetical protein
MHYTTSQDLDQGPCMPSPPGSITSMMRCPVTQQDASLVCNAKAGPDALIADVMIDARQLQPIVNN